jgi:hypothetical protein
VGGGNWGGGAELIESRGWGGPGVAGFANSACFGRGGYGRRGGVAAGDGESCIDGESMTANSVREMRLCTARCVAGGAVNCAARA